ncbi:MAG: hypothetical protein J6Y93_02580 [Treponema sp.]|nr:hypothetical protein [Treponema sp.]
MKKILFGFAALSLASLTFAQDFDFAGGDDMGSFEESSSPAVAITGEVGADVRAWIGSTDEGYDTKGYDSLDSVSKSLVDANAYAKIDFAYSGDVTDALIKTKLDAATIKAHPEDVIDEAYAGGSFKEGTFQFKAGKMKEVWGKGDKVHVLDNFNANDYSDFIFPDYIDRRLGEVMFKATANLSWDYNVKLEGIYTPWMTADRFADSGMLVPASMTTLTETVEGIVKHNAAIDLENSLSGVPDYPSIVDGLQTMSSFTADELYEDNLKTLRYGQAGLRLTGSLAGIDWGTSYYYGHYKQPSANLGAYIDSVKTGITNAVMAYAADSANQATIATNYNAEFTAFANYRGNAYQAAAHAGLSSYVSPVPGDTVHLTDPTAINAAAQKDALYKVCSDHAEEWYANGTITVTDKYALPSLNYDQVQVFGVEAAFVLLDVLNTRFEVAYNLTEDTAGDNPWVKNNSISWVVGFDIDLPIHNLNLNVQNQGSYILKNDKIKDGAYAEYDVDYNSDGKYTSNKIIALLSDSFLNEKLKVEVQGIYGIECKEWMVAPKIEYNAAEGLFLTARGVYLYSDNENGEFYNFTAGSKNNDKAFFQLSARYQF